MSNAAVNIQQIARSIRAVSSAPIAISRSSRRLSEEEQKRSVHAVYEAKKWLIEEERSLQSNLEATCSCGKTESHVRYSVIRSLRLWLDELSVQIVNGGDEVTIDSIRQIIQQIKLLKS